MADDPHNIRPNNMHVEKYVEKFIVIIVDVVTFFLSGGFFFLSNIYERVVSAL